MVCQPPEIGPDPYPPRNQDEVYRNLGRLTDAAFQTCAASGVSGHHHSLGVDGIYPHNDDLRAGVIKHYPATVSFHQCDSHNFIYCDDETIDEHSEFLLDGRPTNMGVSSLPPCFRPMECLLFSADKYYFNVPVELATVAAHLNYYLNTPSTEAQCNDPTKSNLPLQHMNPRCTLVIQRWGSGMAAQSAFRSYINDRIRNINWRHHFPGGPWFVDLHEEPGPEMLKMPSLLGGLSSLSIDNSIPVFKQFWKGINPQSIGTYATITASHGPKGVGQYCFGNQEGSVLFVRNECTIGITLSQYLPRDRHWALAAAIDAVILKHSRRLEYEEVDETHLQKAFGDLCFHLSPV
ncbi:hypothetical protein ABW21_db0202706 [Orbilia brochopaga]|nr:hypothetical protein ABW21_db0202706 [Drechslerella brochopaga]